MTTFKKLTCLCALAVASVLATAGDASACHRRCKSGCYTQTVCHTPRRHHGCGQVYVQTCYTAPTYAYTYAPAQYGTPQGVPSGQYLPTPPAPGK
jgi:hypothetical protein